MIYYNLCFVFNTELDRTVLIRKTHPDWQAGKLNAPGGKIEAYESSSDATYREVNEETSLRTDPKLFLIYYGRRREPYVMYAYWAVTDDLETARTVTEEKVELFAVSPTCPDPGDMVRGAHSLLHLALQAAKNGDYL